MREMFGNCKFTISTAQTVKARETVDTFLLYSYDRDIHTENFIIYLKRKNCIA